MHPATNTNGWAAKHLQHRKQHARPCVRCRASLVDCGADREGTIYTDNMPFSTAPERTRKQFAQRVRHTEVIVLHSTATHAFPPCAHFCRSESVRACRTAGLQRYDARGGQSTVSQSLWRKYRQRLVSAARLTKWAARPSGLKNDAATWGLNLNIWKAARVAKKAGNWGPMRWQPARQLFPAMDAIPAFLKARTKRSHNRTTHGCTSISMYIHGVHNRLTLDVHRLLDVHPFWM